MKLKNSIYILAIAFLSACSVNEPNLPSWDTEWTLYLPVENFLMSEAIDDSILFADTTSNGIPIMEFSLSDSTDWERIEATDLSVEGQTDYYEASLGDFDLADAPVLSTDSIGVAEIFPPELIGSGDSIPPHPPIIATPPPVAAIFNHYLRVQVESGSIWITFHNNLLLGISPGMEVAVYNDDGSNELLDVLTFPDSIPAGAEIESNRINLSNKEISNQIRMEYTVPIAGSDTVQIISEEFTQGYFYSELHLDRLKVSWAEAKIPSQVFNESDSVNVDQDDILLKRAVIEKGTINVRLNNHLPINAQVQVELPDFLEDGVPKVINRYVVGGIEETIEITLDGLELVNSVNPDEYIDYTRYTIQATIDSSEENVIVSATDYVSVEMEVDSLYFSTVEGALSNMQFEIEPTEINDLDFLEDFEGGLRLNDLEMDLTFQNEIDFPIDIEFHVVGYHEEGGIIIDSSHVYVNETISRSSEALQTLIVLDDDYLGGSIADLLEILPTRIKVYGVAVLNSVGSVSVNQGMRMEYTVSSPLSIEINTAITQEGDVDSLTTDDLDENTQDMLSNDISEAEAVVYITNGLPVGVTFSIYIATDSTNLDTDVIADSTLKLVINGEIEAGGINTETGYVDAPATSPIVVGLSKQQLQIFKTVPLYYKQKFVLLPTDGVAQFRQTDDVELDAMIRVQYIMNNQE